MLSVFKYIENKYNQKPIKLNMISVHV